ncbi:MAG TPA: TetR/AcrR family transcriptional regulator [Acidimicrobiales bacterium]
MVTLGAADDRAGPEPSVDGRSAIRDRNRNAVLDAVLDLFSEDNLSPGPDEVALRAGLSVRSVYRYFDDHDSLSRAAIDRQLERLDPLALIPSIGEGALDDRIGRFVDMRLRLQAEAGPTIRATRKRATFDLVVRDQFESDRVRMRAQIERHFAPELAAAEGAWARSRLAAVDALCSFESLDHYLVHRGLDPLDARVMLADALRALLTP